jgi:hypothetical protein
MRNESSQEISIIPEVRFETRPSNTSLYPNSGIISPKIVADSFIVKDSFIVEDKENARIKHNKVIRKDEPTIKSQGNKSGFFYMNKKPYEFATEYSYERLQEIENLRVSEITPRPVLTIVRKIDEENVGLKVFRNKSSPQ